MEPKKDVKWPRLYRIMEINPWWGHGEPEYVEALMEAKKLLRPFVEPLVRRAIEKIESTPRWRKRLRTAYGYMMLKWGSGGGRLAGLKAFFTMLFIRKNSVFGPIEDPSDHLLDMVYSDLYGAEPTVGDVKEAVERQIDEEIQNLIMHWVIALAEFAQDERPASRLLPLSELDQAMLPPSRRKYGFDAEMRNSRIGSKGARTALQRLRASLEKGRTIPQVIVRLLEVEGVRQYDN